MTKFAIAFREMGTHKEVLRSQVMICALLPVSLFFSNFFLLFRPYQWWNLWFSRSYL